MADESAQQLAREIEGLLQFLVNPRLQVAQINTKDRLRLQFGQGTTGHLQESQRIPIRAPGITLRDIADH
jgi:hypothetical protein